MLPTASATQTGKKLIALTFDDGPGGPTPRLLDGLAARGARATFFMLGQCASNAPKTVRRAFLEGHEIASHTYSHYQLTAKSDETVLNEVQKTDALLDEILGMDLDYLIRPPYGSTNAHVLGLLGAPAIIWSLDTLDWKYRDADWVCGQIVQNAYNGVIVLCHDIHSTTVDGALAAIDILQARGYEFVTVSELYRRRGVQMNDGERYSTCMRDESDIGGVEAPEAEVSRVLGGYQLTLTSAQDAPLWYRFEDETVFHEYSAPIVIEGGQKVYCYAAFNVNGGRSEATQCTAPAAAVAPVLSPAAGQGAFSFVLQAGACVRYTTDGSEPDASSVLYTQPIAAFDGVLCAQSLCPGGAGQAVRYTACIEGWLLLDILEQRSLEKTCGVAAALGICAALGR